jgi:3,4-dihydroxy 2-butanone 4-phosphate synthase/GTP cyclohydrolase II
MGDVSDGDAVLVDVHAECLTGDIFRSLRCRRAKLDAALAAVATEGRGVVLYVRGPEDEQAGLLHKLQAYEMEDSGGTEKELAVHHIAVADSRDYGTGGQILSDLGVRTMRRCIGAKTSTTACSGNWTT